MFTPRGDPRALPAGSTPIDFAYAIHTEVGHRCIGARVNGRLVPLDVELHNGDTVEILTSKAEDAGPSRDWLRVAQSTRAQSKIRSHFNRERREDATERGREAITRALRKKGIGFARAVADGHLAAVADELSYKELEALYRAVGEHHVGPGVVANHVARRLEELAEPEAAPVVPPEKSPIRIGATEAEDVTVEGDSGMLVSLARCCTPVPGDAILGFVTRGRGVSVHRTDCPNVTDLQQHPERFVPVEWSGTSTPGSTFMVAIEIEAFDRKHLLRDITAVLGDLHINITSAQVTTRQGPPGGPALHLRAGRPGPPAVRPSLGAQRRRGLRRLPGRAGWWPSGLTAPPHRRTGTTRVGQRWRCRRMSCHRERARAGACGRAADASNRARVGRGRTVCVPGGRDGGRPGARPPRTARGAVRRGHLPQPP